MLTVTDDSRKMRWLSAPLTIVASAPSVEVKPSGLSTSTAAPSAYVPGPISIVSPGLAAATASVMVVKSPVPFWRTVMVAASAADVPATVARSMKWIERIDIGHLECSSPASRSLCHGGPGSCPSALAVVEGRATRPWSRRRGLTGSPAATVRPQSPLDVDALEVTRLRGPAGPMSAVLLHASTRSSLSARLSYTVVTSVMTHPV